jgi:hypothetical protein
MRVMMSLIVSFSVLAGAASAKAALRDVPEIDDNMLWVAIAIEIGDKCDVIAPRTVRGLAFLYSLKKKANALGYSDAEIDAYRKSDVEKARIRAEGEAYVKSKGLNPAVPADLCTLGQAEIAKGSQIGVLLKAK